jgi:hypothetical protein
MTHSWVAAPQKKVLCNISNYSRYLLFSDNIRIFHAVISAEDGTLWNWISKLYKVGVLLIKLNITKTGDV